MTSILEPRSNMPAQLDTVVGLLSGISIDGYLEEEMDERTFDGNVIDRCCIRVRAGKSVANLMQDRLIGTYLQRGTMRDRAFTVIAAHDGYPLRHHARIQQALSSAPAPAGTHGPISTPPIMSCLRHLTAALLTGAVSLFAPTAGAQLASAPSLPLGRTVDGTLTRTGPTLNERGRFQVFRLDVKPGTRYSIVMRADDFDSFLSVARQVDGLTDYLASDDDGASNSNARLRWTPKDAGAYYLVAQSLKADGTGNFTLRMDTMPAVIITPPRTLALDVPLTGELAETDPAVAGTGSYYDLYEITARKGQRLSIEMSGADIDAFVGIGRMLGDSLDILDTDDDGGGAKNARLRYTVKEDGTYIIRAQALDVSSTGSYRIAVSEMAIRPSVSVNLTSGVAVSGTIMEGDEEADDGTSFDGYRITVRAGETVTITMRSAALDSYLVLGELTDGNFATIKSDDDGAGGNNARIEHTFDRAGEYLIRANVVGTSTTGAYTIRVDRGAAARKSRRS